MATPLMMTQTLHVPSALACLAPVEVESLIRVGGDSDGGYVVPEGLICKKSSVLGHMADGRTLDEIKQLVSASQMEAFGDYNGMDRVLMENIVTMWDYLYRYREPNVSIKQDEALRCIEDSAQCRTGLSDL